MLLDRYDSALDHTVGLRVKVCGNESRFTSTRCSTSCIRQDSELQPNHYVYPAVLQSGRRSRSPTFPPISKPLDWESRRLRPLGKIVHTDQEVPVSSVAPGKGPSYIGGHPFEGGSDVVLMHLAPIPSTGGRDWLHRCLTAGIGMLQGRTIWAIFDRTSVNSQWRSTRSMRFQFGPLTFIRGAPGSMPIHSDSRSDSASSSIGPMSGLFSSSVLRATGTQPAAVTAATARICLTPARTFTL